MKAPFSHRSGSERGVVLFFTCMIALILVPIMMVFLKNSIEQNRRSVKDKSIKSAREMADTSAMDSMRTFSTDYNRNYYDPLFWDDMTTTFPGFGSSSVTRDTDPINRTMKIKSRATYKKAGVDARLDTSKGVDALVLFQTDLYRFGLMVDSDLNMKVDMPAASGRNLSRVDAWINGDFTLGGVTAGSIRNCVWVVVGTFTCTGVPASFLDPAAGEKTVIYCRFFVGPASLRSRARVDILEIPGDQPMFPPLEIVNPGADDRLEYYNTRNDLKIITPNALDLLFSPGNLKVTEVPPVGGPLPSVNYALTASTFTVVTEGASRVDISGIVNKKVTVVALPNPATGVGGDVLVYRNLTYSGGPTANATSSLAVLAWGKLTFWTDATDQTVSGFFYSRAKYVVILNPARLLWVRGTIFGAIRESALPFADGSTLNTIRFVPDPDLTRYPPVNLPQRPTVVQWRNSN